MRLKDKVCVITGGAAGIGKGIAVKMASEGARVALCDIDEDGLRTTAAELRDIGQPIEFFKVDVTRRLEVERMIEAVVETWGRIDCLVANAGITQDCQFPAMTDEQWDRVIGVNLTGVFLCGQAAAKVMIPQRSGCILVTSSVVGLYGNFGQTNYAATKAGVIGMVKTWSKELGRHGIRTVAVCPGLIETAILSTIPEKVIESMKQKVPLRRAGTVEEVAKVFAFLASDEASYVSGVALEVAGGLLI
jgi:3-oxoacyl-[acyl-carrier protein] reductase